MPDPQQENALAAPDFSEFEKQARAEGFDEVLKRTWSPGVVIDTHAHPFAVKAVVVQGEMWLSCAGETRHLRPGDSFAVERDAPHAERYGDTGATSWVARRNG